LAENVKIPSHGGKRLKLLKNCHVIFERSSTLRTKTFKIIEILKKNFQVLLAKKNKLEVIFGFLIAINVTELCLI